MPLPANPNAPWPPAERRAELNKMAEWSAWYSGDPARLRDVYASGSATGSSNRRWSFWRRMADKPTTGERAEFHVPVAGDLASVTAGLLFGEEPRIRIAEAFVAKPTRKASRAQFRLEELILRGGTYNRLVEAAETAAAIGGVYLYPAWDGTVADYPVVGVAQADNAIPEFSFGMLRSVTFFRDVSVNGNQVVRHVELHERTSGQAHILHALYQGSATQIGRRLTDADLLRMTGLSPEVVLPFGDLDVTYVPNIRPNRLWRNSSLGVSDYVSSEGVLDAIDETYSSWMRDVRLAKARILVPVDYLDANKEFDVDREAFVPLNMETEQLDSATTSMLANQFSIRAADHKATIVGLLERVVSNAGYSLETFGLTVTGTPARYRREPKSAITMNRRGHWWQPAIARVMRQVLEVDADRFSSGVEVFTPEVTVSPSMVDDPAEMARTLAALKTAMAASTRERVSMLHPTWGKDAIDVEVGRIVEEEGIGKPKSVPGFPSALSAPDEGDGSI